jgi:hypothetical protein
MINIEGEWLTGLIVRQLLLFLPFLFLFALISQSQALSTGIDSRADDGCLCHGGADETTVVTLSGLPEQYNSSQEYNITLAIDSPVGKDVIQGGFRIIISDGEIVGDDWQLLDNGYTHTSEINDRRVWNAVWVAPEETDQLATFIIHGNAVNGDNSPTGDEWNSQSLAIPGPDYTGDSSAPELSNSPSNSELAVGGLAIALIAGLAILAVRD